MELIHCAFLHNSKSNAKSHGNISSRWTPPTPCKGIKENTAPVTSLHVRTHGKKQQGCALLLPGAYTAGGHQRSGLLRGRNGNQPHGKDGAPATSLPQERSSPE